MEQLDPFDFIRLCFAYTVTVPVRSCLVSFTDSESIEHSTRVREPIRGGGGTMAAFKKSVLAEMPLAPGTRLTIRVKAPEEGTPSHSQSALMARRRREQSEREVEEE